jgi:DeoR/GlpR family transcriptional regulator of sugar metabolism
MQLGGDYVPEHFAAVDHATRHDFEALHFSRVFMSTAAIPPDTFSPLSHAASRLQTRCHEVNEQAMGYATLFNQRLLLLSRPRCVTTPKGL